MCSPQPIRHVPAGPLCRPHWRLPRLLRRPVCRADRGLPRHDGPVWWRQPLYDGARAVCRTNRSTQHGNRASGWVSCHRVHQQWCKEKAGCNMQVVWQMQAFFFCALPCGWAVCRGRGQQSSQQVVLLRRPEQKHTAVVLLSSRLRAILACQKQFNRHCCSLPAALLQALGLAA